MVELFFWGDVAFPPRTRSPKGCRRTSNTLCVVITSRVGGEYSSVSVTYKLGFKLLNTKINHRPYKNIRPENTKRFVAEACVSNPEQRFVALRNVATFDCAEESV